MNRRAFLAAAGSGMAALAGCGADSGSGTGAPTGESSGGSGGSTGSSGGLEFGRSATAGEQSVTVWGASVRSSIRYATEGRALDVYAPDGAHLLFVRITTDGRPQRSTFGLAAADETLDPLDGVGGASLSDVQHRYPPYAPGGEGDPDGRWLLFEVSPEDLGDAPAVVWQPGEGRTAEWPLPDSDREALAAPVPRFELDGFEVPETAPEDDPTATIVVTNASEVDGTFRATVNYRGPLEAADNLDLSIPAGETSATEYEIVPPSGGELRLELAWSGPNERRTIDFG